MPTLSEEETNTHLSNAIQASGPSQLSGKGGGGGVESNMTKEELEALEAKKAEKREVRVAYEGKCFHLYKNSEKNPR